jgi:hypothetical protein
MKEYLLKSSLWWEVWGFGCMALAVFYYPEGSGSREMMLAALLCWIYANLLKKDGQ